MYYGKTDVFIHADIDMPQSEYAELELYASKRTNVQLTDRRYHGVLDTRSLCDIALEMVRKAKKTENASGKKYRYFALLSGQDYLIKPMNWIEKELEDNYPKPLIDCTPYASTNWVYHKFVNTPSVLYYYRWLKKMPQGVLKTCFRIIGMIYRKVTRRLGIGVYKDLNNENIMLYGGSAWWILPDQAIDYILEEYEKNPRYVRTLLNKTNTPEETFFQIMTMRSPVAPMVDINPVEMTAQNCKTWAYFVDEGKPFRGHPYIFTQSEYEKLRTSDCWIARKFDATIDSKILDLIDMNLLKEE